MLKQSFCQRQGRSYRDWIVHIVSQLHGIDSYHFAEESSACCQESVVWDVEISVDVPATRAAFVLDGVLHRYYHAHFFFWWVLSYKSPSRLKHSVRRIWTVTKKVVCLHWAGRTGKKWQCQRHKLWRRYSHSLRLNWNACHFHGCFWTKQGIHCSLPLAMPGKGQSTAPSVKSYAMQFSFRFPKHNFPIQTIFRLCKMPVSILLWRAAKLCTSISATFCEQVLMRNFPKSWVAPQDRPGPWEAKRVHVWRIEE